MGYIRIIRTELKQLQFLATAIKGGIICRRRNNFQHLCIEEIDKIILCDPINSDETIT